MFSNGINNLFRLLIKGKTGYIYAGLRRRYLYYFRRGYVDVQLSRRKGACSVKGHCCRKTLPWCEYLIDEKCSIYDKQPLFCRIFPIDEKDKELSQVKETCGYHFEDNRDSP
jgi:Fe-S-cluster containining protein